MRISSPKTEKTILCVIIAVFLWIAFPSAVPCFAQSITNLIPASRLTKWTVGETVGVPGGIPAYRSHLIDVTQSPYSADKTGVTNAGPAIQAAINAAQSNDVVYLPAGTFMSSNTLFLKSDFTLRGAGMTSTKLLYAGTGSAVLSIDNGFPQAVTNLLSGTLKGSTNLTVTDTSAFLVGGQLLVSLLNDSNQFASPVTVHVQSYTNLRRQTVKLLAKTSTTLSFWPPLYEDCIGGSVRYGTRRAGGVGIEDLTLDGSASATVQRCVILIGISESWMKNVKCYNVANYIVDWESCVNCEMRGCWIDNPTAQSGPNHGGFKLVACSGILCENNIICRTFPNIEVNQGCSGCVFSYNFCVDSTSGAGVEGVSIDANHDPHNRLNLYEGNVAPNLMCDGYYGSSSQDSVFRNWFHGVEPGMAGGGWCLALERFTRNYNLLGNAIGTNGVTAWRTSFGNPNLGNGSFSGYGPPWVSWNAMLTNTPGNGPGATGFQESDTNVLQTTILLGNYYFFTNGVPPGEQLGTNALPPSLYLSGAPSWWGTNHWPAIGPDVNPVVGMIPAQERYLGIPVGGKPGPLPPSNLRILGSP